MYGRTAAQLVREVNNDDNHIRRFNYDLFDKVIAEIQEHFQQVTSIMEKMQEDNDGREITPADENYNGALIHHQSILRNKRCLLAYMYHRAHRLQGLRWQLGAVLPEDVKGLLHPSEKEFVKSYSEALSSYMTKLDIDLTVDMTPPKDPYIQIRVLDDIGEVLLGDQSTSLLRNSIHFVKRSEAETLISQRTVDLHPRSNGYGIVRKRGLYRIDVPTVDRLHSARLNVLLACWRSLQGDPRNLLSQDLYALLISSGNRFMAPGRLTPLQGLVEASSSAVQFLKLTEISQVSTEGNDVMQKYLLP